MLARMASDDSRSGDLAALVPRRGYALALLVLVGSLVLVFTAWNVARERELRAAATEFVSSADKLAVRLRNGMLDHELVARGGASLFASLARPTPTQWRAYVDGMAVQRFPGMVGLGFVGHVRGSRLDELQLEWRDSGFGMLEVRPRGTRPAYAPILYLEPRTPANLEAVGFDLYAQPVTRSALERALESGQPALTGPLQLLQDRPSLTRGLVLFLPVYRAGDRPATPAARRLSIQGWVSVPMRVEGFVRGALGGLVESVRMRIYDLDDDPVRPMYVSPASSDARPPAFRRSVEFEQYGRRWRVEFESPPLAEAVPRLRNLQNMLALGLFSALLLYAVAWMLARTEAQAYRLAARMTEDYRRSEMRFRSAMQYSAIGKALLDSEGRIVEANPALAGIVGLPMPRLIGTRFEALFESESSEDESGPDAQGVRRATRWLHRLGGEPRQVQLTYAPVPGNVGQDVVGLVQVEDVTERRRAEARVRALNRTLEARVALRTRELSQANQELEAFAYSVSHDLRAPLRAIDGFSRILLERYGDSLDDTARGYLLRVRKAAGRMGELIDALLKMSRLSRSELKLEPVDLSRLAADVIEELRVGEPGRQVEARIEPGLQVVGDAALLRNLLGNLLGNAWKFTRRRADATIEFGAAGSGGAREFYVRDNGAGFSQAYADKLFRPFQRLHANTEFSGHGVGLASVKRIIERHGGGIRAEGEEGVGATFWFTLPEAEPEDV